MNGIALCRVLTGREADDPLEAAGQVALVGELILDGEELKLLRDRALYIDVHTPERISGLLRIDLAFPRGT